MNKVSLTEPLDPLTERETEVLRLLAEGYSNKEVAAELVISVGTVKWYVMQIFGKFGVNRRTEAVARARELNLLEITEEPRLASRHTSNLPVQTTSFIGREDDIEDIKHLLLDEPDCQLLTLVGPGGIGKSRVALATAAEMINEMPDGVYFVPLAPVYDVADIVPTIAQILHFTFYGKTEPKDQLLDYLYSKKLLLVLDNFEHLRTGSDLLTDILKHAPDVLLLTTSRERLNLQEEWIFIVSGLSYPADDNLESKSGSETDLETYQAVKLFSHRARQADTNFSPTDEIIDIARICQLVEGMPLGLELAAGWVHTLSCNEIALQIERSLDFLTSSKHNIPERHQSLRVVIEQTWQRLSADEQSAMSQLSVFHGGCTRDAARAITGTSLTVLSTLIDKALLRRTDTGRYELHELLRQFSEEKLEQNPKQVEQIRQKHREYFIAFLEARTAEVKRSWQKETLAEIKADIDNVRFAWRLSATQKNVDALERAAECLFVYYLYGNGYDEGYIEFGHAANSLIYPANVFTDDNWMQHMLVADGQEIFASYLLSIHGYFLAHRRDLVAGQKVLEQSLIFLRQNQSSSKQVQYQRAEASALAWLGWAVYFQGQFVEGESYASESLAHFSEIGDHWGEGWSLCLLGGYTRYTQPIKAEQTYRRGVAVCEKYGDQSVLSYNSFNLGNVLRESGHFTQAQVYIDRGVTIAEQMQNRLGLGYSLLCRGQLEIDLGKYQQATQTLEQSVIYFNEIGTIHVSRAKFFLGMSLHLRGDYLQAAQLYTQAYDGIRSADSRLGIVSCLNGFGRLAYDQGKLQESEEFHRKALTIAVDMHMEPEIASTLRYLGQVMTALGKTHHADAKQYFIQALEVSTRHRLAPLALATCVDWAKLSLQTNRVELLVKLLTLATQHKSSTYETREQARSILTHITDHFLNSATRSIHRINEYHNLWETVQEVLAEMKTD
jgi:predicted ATPase/DNA-binding CsgD family transcriptional regulator